MPIDEEKTVFLLVEAIWKNRQREKSLDSAKSLPFHTRRAELTQ